MAVKSVRAKEKAKEALSDEILNAAERVLAARGYAQTSMAAVAREAGVSVGSLYNYFRDKNELFRKLFQVRKLELIAEVERSLQTNRPFPEQLEVLTRNVLAFFDKNRMSLRNNLYNERPPPAASKRASPPFRDFLDGLQPLMRQGIEEGFLNPHFNRVHAGIYSGILRGFLMDRIDDPTANFADFTSDLIQVFLKGVAP